MLGYLPGWNWTLSSQLPYVSLPAHQQSRATDVYQVHLIKLPKCEPSLIYECIQISSVLANRDLMLPVLHIRLKGKNLAELCSEVTAAFPNRHLLFKKPIACGIHLQMYFTP